MPRAPAEKKSQPAAFLLFTLLREKHSRVLSRIYFPRWNTWSHRHRVILLTLLYAMLYRTLCIQLERYHCQVLEIQHFKEKWVERQSESSTSFTLMDFLISCADWLMEAIVLIPCNCRIAFSSPPFTLYFYLSPETVAPPEKMLPQRIVPLLFVNNWFWALYLPAPLLIGMIGSTQGAECVHRLSKRSLISLKRGRNTATVCRSHNNTGAL